MAAEVSSGVVFDEQWTEALHQTLCGAVLGHRPNRVVACHQQEVCLGQSQSLLQPSQLAIGIQFIQGSTWLLVRIVVRVTAKHHSVKHDDGQSLPRVGNAEVQLIVVRWEFPIKGNEEASKLN